MLTLSDAELIAQAVAVAALWDRLQALAKAHPAAVLAAIAKDN
jgi:hypothetical protein